MTRLDSISVRGERARGLMVAWRHAVLGLPLFVLLAARRVRKTGLIRN